ncbi:MAG: type I DNA topoisomerase [Gemmatimonadota bacterium]
MGEKKIQHLVIVESPAKARTLERYLGDDYVVEASVGHVMDLPESELGVDVERGFEPQWVTTEGRASVIRKLRRMAKGAEEILLATDPDREGEAIAYHIARHLGYDGENGGRFRRVTFNELTRAAVLEAIRNPGEIDLLKVDAQQARRVLDRLVGYKLSPLLWKKISRGLSAGRVQSVAVRLMVERERERRRFHTAAYWDLEATLAVRGAEFRARLLSLGGLRVATGKDFDESTGRLLTGREVLLLDEETARSHAERLRAASFEVSSLEQRRSTRSPYPPFTTSTLQQEANRKLNMSARETMSIAQRLYQAGHITYMRTDSVHLSSQAIAAARDKVRALYGTAYLSPEPRRYRTRTKGAQEAHEAIRPAGTEMRRADEVGLTGRDRALYDLIWKRAVACQMADARQRHLTALIAGEDAVFRATGKFLEFAGFFRAYVEGSDDPEAALEDREEILPEMQEGDEVECRGLEVRSHETKPPPRYTEASLVKELEADGIGRPSTYATILSNVVARGYAVRQGKQLVPTFTAFAVTRLLEDHFSDLVDVGFTARMESALDDIAAGQIEWRSYLSSFYHGEDGFEAQLTTHESQIDPREASTVALEELEPRVRIGRYGPFLELVRDGHSLTATIPDGVAPAELTNELAMEWLRRKAEGPDEIGRDPETGKPVYLRIGRFGPYVQLGASGEGETKPRTASLPKDMPPEEVTLGVALRLLAMPYELGRHPETGEPVRVGIGRYGPYVVHQGDYRSLREGDDVLSISLERALELLAEPRRGSRRRTAARPVRDLGSHPEDGQAVQIFEGRYGPYVKHGKVNASLPKELEVEDVTLEEALDLLAARRARASRKKRTPKKSEKKSVAKGAPTRRKGR